MTMRDSSLFAAILKPVNKKLSEATSDSKGTIPSGHLSFFC